KVCVGLIRFLGFRTSLFNSNPSGVQSSTVNIKRMHVPHENVCSNTMREGEKMEIAKKLSGRNIAIAVGLAVLFGVAFALVLRAYRNEGEKRSAAISENGEKDPNH